MLLLSVTKLIEIAFFSAPINRAEKSAGLTEGGFFGVVVWVKRVLLLPRSALSFCQELLFFLAWDPTPVYGAAAACSGANLF